jgi:pantoate--beta-alanine ligase
MQVFSTPELLRSYISDNNKHGKTIGLVPTMGALHQGHLELIRTSRLSNDITICSIYVNPAQFNNKQDLVQYPRDLKQDLKKLESVECQAVFCPPDEVMYPDNPVISMDFGQLEKVMEGYFRPGHFKGVALVVSKLFHMVQPDKAYFGEKDWQQLVIIKRLVDDLHFPLEIVSMPIVRETDGLAMSSRNRRLTAEQREVANELYRTLLLVKKELESKTPVESATGLGREYLGQVRSIKLEYLEVVRAYSLDAPVEEPGLEPLSICIAAYLGEVRLIDNVQVFNKET